MSPEDSTTLAQLLALLVHDLRNPVATIGANLSYVGEAAGASLDTDAREALADSTSALDGLMAGLDNLATVSRWVGGEPAAAAAEGNVADALRAVAARERMYVVTLSLSEGVLRAKGAQALPRLVEILLANAVQHTGGKPVTLRARRVADEVLVEVEDTGRAIAPELREVAFTPRGQLRLKERSDGRYGRSLGLFAAGLLAQAMGARLEAAGRDGAAVIRIALQAA
jgi:signal transduction histidine kinase